MLPPALWPVVLIKHVVNVFLVLNYIPPAPFKKNGIRCLSGAAGKYWNTPDVEGNIEQQIL